MSEGILNKACVLPTLITLIICKRVVWCALKGWCAARLAKTPQFVNNLGTKARRPFIMLSTTGDYDINYLLGRVLGAHKIMFVALLVTIVVRSAAMICMNPS